MKVKCVNNVVGLIFKETLPLTLGKTYEVTSAIDSYTNRVSGNDNRFLVFADNKKWIIVETELFVPQGE